MYQRVLLGLVAGASWWLAAPALPQDSLADVIEVAEKSVVRIEVSGRDGTSLGSGFVVDNAGTLVTNCHVLAGATAATAHFPDGQSTSIAGTFVIDESRDIVVARLASSTAPSIPIADMMPRKGERVTALGSPHGLSFTATTGIVSAVRSAREMAADVGRSEVQGTWIQVDAALSPGNSGGPLINAQGAVVAMSTLASSGSAQNLNFGISGEDIQRAVQSARTARLVSLADGVARLQMESGRGGQPGSAGPAPIPPQAFEEYIAAGQAEFSELLRGLKMEAARLNNDLKEMRRGESYIPNQVRTRDASVVRVQVPGQRAAKWFFRSDAIKDATLDRQRERIRRFSQLKSEIDDPRDPDAVLSLLWNYGPKLQALKVGSIGFVSDLIVVHAFNQHDVLVSLDDNPYLLWMDSTAGVTPGQLMDGPMFVAGTATAELSQGMTAAITVLVQVPEASLEAAVRRQLGGRSAPSGATSQASVATDGFRVWNDRTGKFSVEAQLLGADASQAVLKKRDGSIVNVPLTALSDADRRFLGK